MQRHRLIWQLFPAFLLIALAALTAVTLFSTQAVRFHLVGQFEDDLSARALLLAPRFVEALRNGDDAQVDETCDLLGAATETDLSVMRLDGSLVGSSRDGETLALDKADRPEVQAALRGETRFTHQLNIQPGEDTMYTALAIKRGEEVLGVVRVGQSMAPINQAVRAIYIRLLIGGLLVTVVVAVVSWWVAQRLIRPIEEMKHGAVRFAAGELNQPMALPDAQEMAELADAMNKMAKQLDERIRTVLEQRNEREAILSSMVEGVIAVDSNQRIISMNRAAAELFDADPARVQGKSIQHAVRNPRVAELIADTLAEQGAISREMKVYTRGREVALQAHAAGLRDAAGKAIGVVVVLDDVTDLRRLERMRSDFVANVSHELRTPITSIKGFVETLLDGGMDNADDARRFLEIVAKQADRLNAIIEDLLTLSRVEQDERAHDSLLTPGALLPAVNGAVQLCASAAQAKEVRIVNVCPPGLRARINAPLLEQGVTNLIDNAIKYSEQGGEVRVEVTEAQDEITIAVIDHGCGIAADHLPRLFERFYRVDKARSRQLGGTGLGLAIVKHIAQTHGGRVVVDSKPGQGSTFRILLPVMDPAKGHLELAI